MKKRLNITFKETMPDEKAYFELFESTGWNKEYDADSKELHKALSNSWYTLCAYTDDGKLIGFGRLISDGILYAFICDLIITPLYKNQGIGSRILINLIQKCKKKKIRILWLFSAQDKSRFYKKHGFKERPLNAPGMQLELNIK